MKATVQTKEIREAFQQLEGHASPFVSSLQKQFRKTRSLSEKQVTALFEIRDNFTYNETDGKKN